MRDVHGNAEGKVFLENTRILSSRISASTEQIELTVDHIISRILSQNASLGFEEVYAKSCAVIHSPSHQVKAHICRRLCERPQYASQLIGSLLSDAYGDELDASALGKIAYVHNKRNDDAFLLISGKLGNAKAMYVGSFSESCEAVFDNKSEYCLLPIENRIDGKLYSFYSMLDKYELKICRTVSLSGDEDSQNVTLALASKSLPTLKSLPRSCRLEFSVVRERSDEVGSIISISEFLGARVSSLGTQPIPYDDLKQRCYFAFDFHGASPLPLIMYMLLEYPRSSIIGIYQIKEI